MRAQRISAIGLLVCLLGALPTYPSAPIEAERKSAVVRVVEEIGPAVVNISTDRVVENPFARGGGGFLDFFFRDFSEGPQREQYVPNSLGSGVILRSEGYVLTNEHVIRNASRIKVTTEAGKEYEAAVQGIDPLSDLAVLKVEGGSRAFPVPPIGRSSELMIGETVIAIGNPFGLSNSVTTGVVSALRRSVKTENRTYTDFIQTDASINPGNSGGPLLDIQGRLIGINTAIYSEAQGIGFAIPVDRAIRVVEDLIVYRQVQPVWNGLVVTDLTPDIARRYGIAESKGALIRKVAGKSPAEKAGLRPGDVLVRISAGEIGGLRDYVTAMSSIKAGTDVAVVVARTGARFTYQLPVLPFPADRLNDLLWDRLGMRVAEITPEMQKKYRLPWRGVVLTEVAARRAAAGRGLEVGDVILEVDGEPLEKGVESFRTCFARAWDRDGMLVRVPRGGYLYAVPLPLD